MKKKLNTIQSDHVSFINRRAFLKQGSLFLSAYSLGITECLSEELSDKNSASPELTIGLITDVHYADKPPAGNRYYRDSIDKIRKAVEEFNRIPVTFTAELGDFIDAAESVKEELGYLETIDKEYNNFEGEHHYVLGNHCVWSLTKSQFLQTVNQPRSYYSFDHGNFHFVVLDACFRSDGIPYGNKNFEWTDTEIPEEEQTWLKNDLDSTSKKTIAFVHQRLDVEGHYGIKSAQAVRKILEQSGKVIAVFQGHYHKNDYKEINGIHYCTFAAKVEGEGTENNAFAVVNIFPDGAIKVEGFYNQTTYPLFK